MKMQRRPGFTLIELVSVASYILLYLAMFSLAVLGIVYTAVHYTLKF